MVHLQHGLRTPATKIQAKHFEAHKIELSQTPEPVSGSRARKPGLSRRRVGFCFQARMTMNRDMVEMKRHLQVLGSRPLQSSRR